MKKKKNKGYNAIAQIEPWQLDAFLDGVYDEQVEKYILEHDEAAKQMAAFKDFDTRMMALLHRESCPETDALLNYQWGLLDEEESVLIAAHIAECAECEMEAMALAMPQTVTEKSSLSVTIKDKLPAWGESLRTFIARLIPEEQVLVPAIRSATESPGVLDVDTSTPFYVNFLFPDLEADPNGFSSNHIYAIAKATKETAVSTAANLHVIKAEPSASKSETSFESFDWLQNQSAVFYIKKVMPGQADRPHLADLYHIDVVAEAVLCADAYHNYYTIIPIDNLMLAHVLPTADYSAYRIMKLTASKPVRLKDEKLPVFPAIDIISLEKGTSPKPISKQKLFTVEELGLDIILTQSRTVDGVYRIEGQVLGATMEAVDKVSLIHDQTVVKTAILTPSGAFTFDKLEQAQYWLCFYGNGVEVCLSVI